MLLKKCRWLLQRATRDVTKAANGSCRPRSVAVAGNQHIMKMQRGPFEALLLEIAEYSEEWLTSAQSLGLAKRMEANRVLGYEGLSQTTNMTTRSRVNGMKPPRRVPRA